MKRTVVQLQATLDESEIAFWERVKRCLTDEDFRVLDERFGKLVRSEARKAYWLMAVPTNARLCEEDLVSEGWIAIISKAIKGFDPYRGIQFTTYCVPWLQQAMARAINKARIIHVPEYLLEEQSRVMKRLEEYRQTGEKAGVPIEQFSREMGMSPEKLDILLRNYDTLSLDTPVIAEDGNLTHGDQIAGNQKWVPAVEQSQYEELLERLLSQLSPDERFIVVRCDGHKESLKQVASQLKKGREFVSRKRLNALKKLRRLAAEMHVTHHSHTAS